MNSNIKKITTLERNSESMATILSELQTLTAFLGIRDENLRPTVPAVQEVVNAKLAALTSLLTDQRHILSTMHRAECADSCKLIIRGSHLTDESREVNLGTPIELMGMPTKYDHLLRRADIDSIEDLLHFLQRHSLLEIRGCGVTKASEIEAALSSYLKKREAMSGKIIESNDVLMDPEKSAALVEV